MEVKHGCLDRKLLITAIGAHVIRMIPPLIVTEEQCDEACAIIEEAVKALKGDMPEDLKEQKKQTEIETSQIYLANEF